KNNGGRHEGVGQERAAVCPNTWCHVLNGEGRIKELLFVLPIFQSYGDGIAAVTPAKGIALVHVHKGGHVERFGKKHLFVHQSRKYVDMAFVPWGVLDFEYEVVYPLPVGAKAEVETHGVHVEAPIAELGEQADRAAGPLARL